MQVKYGMAHLELPELITRSARILKPNKKASINNPEKAIELVIEKPDEGAEIKEIFRQGEQVCIIVNDATRVAGTEKILPVMLNYLNRIGIKDQDIFIQFAEGLHRPTTDDEMEHIVGKEIKDRISLFNHDAYSKSDLIRIGYTKRKTPVDINERVLKADRRIIIGSINYHFFAGFGGGYKSLVPGVAGIETIEANHSLMLENGSRIGVLEGNPVHEDLKEAARMVGCDYAVYTVLNEDKEMLAIFGGEIEAVHKAGCSFVEQTYGVVIDAPADIVVAGCGGYPKDLNLYQAQKTLENAAQAVKENGIIIFVAECPEGIGSEKFYHYAKKFKTVDQLKKALTNQFEIGGHKAYAVARVTEKAKVLIVTELTYDDAAELGFIKCVDLKEAAVQALEQVGKDPLVYFMPAGSITTPILNIK